MAIPPWTIEMLRRGLTDVARKAGDPETIEKLKNQAGELLQDLPQSAARSLDAVLRSAESGKNSVQRWTRKHTAIAIPMMNASGVLLNDSGTGIPLAPGIVEVGREWFAGDCADGSDAKARLDRRAGRCLPVGDGYALAIANNFHAAVAAIALIDPERNLVVHRSGAVRLAGSRPLPDLLSGLMPGRKIIEVGGATHSDAGDFAGLDPCLALIADDGTRAVQLFDFDHHDAMQAVLLPIATMRASDRPEIPSAEAVLTAGADLVVMPGDGLCGGPSCGILIGRTELIDSVLASEGWRSLAASTAVQAMMVVAMETAQGQNDGLPVESLLKTSEENLRGRAERMATRLNGQDAIATCQVTADDARLTSGGRWRLPSRQVRLRHQSRSAATWVAQLRDEMPSVLTRADGDDVVIDLRWIAAADDGKIAEILGGGSVMPDDAAPNVESAPTEPS